MSEAVRQEARCQGDAEPQELPIFTQNLPLIPGENNVCDRVPYLMTLSLFRKERREPAIIGRHQCMPGDWLRNITLVISVSHDIDQEELLSVVYRSNTVMEEESQLKVRYGYLSCCLDSFFFVF